MRKRQLLVHGAYVDDLSRTPRLLEMAHDALRGKEYPFQIQIHDRVVLLLGHVPEIVALLDAGVVDEDVDLAEGFQPLIDEAIGATDARQISFDDGRFCVGRFDECASFLRAFIVPMIIDDDVRTAPSQALGDRLSDSLAAAGDNGDFSGEIHLFCESRPGTTVRFASSRSRESSIRRSRPMRCYTGDAIICLR